jgi:hypothetical protein
MDSTRPSFAIGIQSIKRSFVDARNRGVKLRYLTEIQDANISYCKELMSIVDEVWHLDGIKGNFMISEIEYVAPASSHQGTKLAALIIYSSVREIVVGTSRYLLKEGSESSKMESQHIIKPR